MNSYEKKYKEALERAKRLHSEPTGGTERIVCEQIFPELRESEDEKIRKWLISQLKIKSDDTNSDLNITIDKAISWLEKQGDQPRYNIGDVICDKSCTTLNKEAQPNMEIVDIQNGMYICDKGSFPVSQQDEYELVSKKIDTKLNDDSVSNELREASTKHAEKELKNQTFPDNLEFELIYTFEEGAKWNASQKSAWSEEDENIKEWIMSDINKLLALNRKSFVIADKEITWLKSLKDRVKTQQEWTMQDEEELQIALDTLVKAGQHSSAKWLKNVCLVPQNKWKPSDEQIKALEHSVRSIGESGYSSPYENNTKLLYSLLEDLKKL